MIEKKVLSDEEEGADKVVLSNRMRKVARGWKADLYAEDTSVTKDDVLALEELADWVEGLESRVKVITK